MTKRMLTQSEAEAIVEKAVGAFFDSLTETGLLKVETLNLDGKLITEEHLTQLRRRLEEITWETLRDGCVIVED